MHEAWDTTTLQGFICMVLLLPAHLFPSISGPWLFYPTAPALDLHWAAVLPLSQRGDMLPCRQALGLVLHLATRWTNTSWYTCPQLSSDPTSLNDAAPLPICAAVGQKDKSFALNLIEYQDAVMVKKWNQSWGEHLQNLCTHMHSHLHTHTHTQCAHTGLI